MPVDTFAVPMRGQEQQQPLVSAQEAHVQAGLDQLEAHANYRPNYSDSDIESAILTHAERAAQEEQFVLEEGIDKSFRPELFDEMNQETNQDTTYYTQQRERVAQPQVETEQRAFDMEMTKRSIADGTHLNRAMQIAERIEYEQDQLVLAA